MTLMRKIVDEGAMIRPLVQCRSLNDQGRHDRRCGRNRRWTCSAVLGLIQDSAGEHNFGGTMIDRLKEGPSSMIYDEQGQLFFASRELPGRSMGKRRSEIRDRLGRRLNKVGSVKAKEADTRQISFHRFSGCMSERLLLT